ncbi:MAG TPA: hypothetical protein VIN61_00390 [Gammaproteobacteria bacterium]
MKAVVRWVFAKPYRSLLLAIGFAPLLPVAAAILAAETAGRGVARGLVQAGIGVLGMAVLGFVSGGEPTVFASLGAICFGIGVALGALLRWAGALGLAFQATVALCFVGVGVVSLLGATGAWLGPLVDQIIEALRALGATEQQLEFVRSGGAMVLIWAAIFPQVVIALLLAYWCLAVMSGEPRFGKEFRRLELGRLLGVTASVIVTLSLVTEAALVQNLSSLALFSFLFQGLAVMHAWAHARRWHPAYIAPVYVLLATPTPLIVAAVLGLSAVGLIDNWFNLRAPLQAQP